MELYKSGHNLVSEVKRFIDNSVKIKIISPFIKVNKLKELRIDNICELIVVRWKASDLISNGVTDFEELFNYCQENNIYLYRNVRIHLKAVINQNNELIFGSANFTNKGLGEGDLMNYELSGPNQLSSFEDIQYINNLILTSDFVNRSYFNQLKLEIDNLKNEIGELPKISEIKIKSKDPFLLSNLPMSNSPIELANFCSNQILGNYNEIELACFFHDMANYKLTSSIISQNNFLELLKQEFENQPFIFALKLHIMNNNSLSYGRIVDWIRSNTTTVPTPRNWEIKKQEIVNILFRWICYFDSRFSVRVPGAFAEVIFYNEN
jgi:hypothetical protein